MLFSEARFLHVAKKQAGYLINFGKPDLLSCIPLFVWNITLAVFFNSGLIRSISKINPGVGPCCFHFLQLCADL